MNPIFLQKQLRDNAADLNDFYKDLMSWGDDMKKKEESLRKDTNKSSTSKGDGQTIPKKKKPSESHPVTKEKVKTRLGYTDYKAWDKFDADAECEKVDYSENDESELTDECDEFTKDQAYIEKDTGNKYVKDKKWDQAIECYNKAIDLYTYEPIFYANRALCFLKKQDYEKAESDCTMSLKLDNTYVKALQRRAAAREALDKLDNAKADLLRVLELEPRNIESRTNLENLEKKLMKTQKLEETIQRPVSKFTASRNKKKETRNMYQSTSHVQENKNNDINKMNHRSNNETGINLVKAINKPAHLQSKKPLKRIEIQEISEFVPIQTVESLPKADKPPVFLKTDDLKVVERKSAYSVNEIKESKDHTNNIRMELCTPNNSVQFYSSWRHLKQMEYKYQYLKLIKPENLPIIFKESLESSVFSEILEVLANCFIEKKEDVFSFLKYFTQIRRFSAIVMFLSDNDKNYLQKLFAYIRECGGHPKEELDLLIETYELNN